MLACRRRRFRTSREAKTGPSRRPLSPALLPFQAIRRPRAPTRNKKRCFYSCDRYESSTKVRASYGSLIVRRSTLLARVVDAPHLRRLARWRRGSAAPDLCSEPIRHGRCRCRDLRSLTAAHMPRAIAWPIRILARPDIRSMFRPDLCCERIRAAPFPRLRRKCFQW